MALQELPSPLRRDEEGNISIEDTDEDWSQLTYLLWDHHSLEEIFEARERLRRENEELITEDELYDSDEDSEDWDDMEMIEGFIILTTLASLIIFAIILNMSKEADLVTQYYVKLTGNYWILMLSCIYLFLIWLK